MNTKYLCQIPFFLRTVVKKFVKYYCGHHYPHQYNFKQSSLYLPLFSFQALLL